MKNYIETLLLLVLFTTAFTSCQDSMLTSSDEQEDINVKKTLPNDMLVFDSKENLSEAIEMIRSGCDSKVATRAAVNSYGTSDFKSLVESNKEKLFATLTPEEISQIENDEDDLEYCPDDSIIADFAFAQLLNEAREIQVADTVYRYFANGVAYTSAENREELREIDEEVAKYSAGNAETTDPMDYSKISIGGTTFIPNIYQQEVFDEACGVGKPLYLKNGVYIDPSMIRDVNYNSEGDGGWLHKLWNNIWGKNILAITKFSKSKRMRLGFYDQNYIIYSNIGITVKMQKKVLGIWWNCKASELRLGWSGIELKYKMPKPVKTYFSPNEMPGALNDKTGVPYVSHIKFPFKNIEDVLFNVPLINYNVTVKDVNAALTEGIKAAMEQGPYIIKNLINQTPSTQKGLYAVDDKYMLTIIAPYEEAECNKRTFDKKFYFDTCECLFDFGFLFGEGFKYKGFAFNQADKAILGRGIVYAAVKYKGVWRACRITKSE